MRGDNSQRAACHIRYTGSPPHAWGQSFCVYSSTVCARFTPTCVGTIVQGRRLQGHIAVHTHMRGDNYEANPIPIVDGGSPPHAWGQLQPPRRILGPNRFTPTCVGTIQCPCAGCSGWAVHPHMRGDNESHLQALPWLLGSPPHAWGQCNTPAPVLSMFWFTPTCVGTMVAAQALPLHFSVHPHMRGDNDVDSFIRLHQTGSPPHAWGQFVQRRVVCVLGRFTPTCVGTIALDMNTNRLSSGSPPHAWGQFFTGSEYIGRLRFTPTCVGTISASMPCSFAAAVHPHMRGDNNPMSRNSSVLPGSPPHAWRQYQRVFKHATNFRFTPTCVGTIEPAGRGSAAPPVHPHMRGDNTIKP